MSFNSGSHYICITQYMKFFVVLVNPTYPLHLLSSFLGVIVHVAHPSPSQITSFPVNTQAASLGIAKAYCNSPISPQHKKYPCILWKGMIYVQHIAIEGLATARGIQGSIADRV